MKTKAIIMKRGHKNAVVKLGKKQLAENPNFFRYDGRIYFIHEDRFQLTKQRRFHGFKVNYITYYYPEGKPWPMLPQGETGTTLVTTADGQKPAILPHDVPTLSDQENTMTADEVDTVFATWVARAIAPMATPVLERMAFMIQVMTLCGVGFLIWQMLQLPDKIITALGGT